MEKENASSHTGTDLDVRNSVRDSISAVRGQSLCEPQSSLRLFDTQQIKNSKSRDFVLVVGNCLMLFNATATMIFCLWQEHYAVTHNLRYDPQMWHLGLIFGPFVGYNALAWLAKMKGGIK